MVAVTGAPNRGTTATLDVVGTAAVVDLEAACALYGRDELPYPLGRSRPVGSVWLLTREVAPVEDRLNGGDLRGFRTWVKAVVQQDFGVGCRVYFSDGGTPDLRVQGLAAGGSGFVALQRADLDGIDTVDLYSVSPADVGAVIADSVGLVGPGSHARIAVVGLEDRLPIPPESMDEYDGFGFPIPRPESDGPAVRLVDRRDVVAIGTVQSLCGATRYWVRVDEDGDYLYAPDDAGCAEPLNAGELCACLESLGRERPVIEPL